MNRSSSPVEAGKPGSEGHYLALLCPLGKVVLDYIPVHGLMSFMPYLE